MMKAWRSLLAGWIMMMPLALIAGEIKLHPDAHLEYVNGIPEVSVRISNMGDEPFRVLSIGGQFRELTAQSFPEKSLLPGEVSKSTLLFPSKPSLPGEGPAIIRIRYAHANGGLYSALALAELPDSQANEVPWVSLKLIPASLGQSGKIAVQLLLFRDEPVEATIKLILPDEFSCQAVTRKVMLEPDISRIETFELTNQSAVPGAIYTVFTVAEYSGNGVVHSATSSGTVKVVEVKWIGQSYVFWGGISILLLMGWLFMQRGNGQPQRQVADEERYGFDTVLLVILGVFVIWHLAPSELIRNTTPVGGDTPAHLYLVSHLREQLLHHGRIISWAGGWWCGFPMFQYYFALPYLVAALLSLLIPLNVAFKVVVVAGMVFTPLCAYWAARVWRLPAPVPGLMALAMVPFLFVQSHTMWGVNTASTLAGMIANSWSFALMLPALAFGTRDISEGKIRVGTVLLFVLVLASHFFTSVIMFVTLAIVPVLYWGRARRSAEPAAIKVSFLRGVMVLGVEAGMALMLMGWWLVPLIAKSGFSMDFGGNWDLSLIRSFPAYCAGLMVFSWIAIGFGIKRSLLALWILCWMLVVSTVLFLAGFSVSPVFVNVRLWPFIFFAIVALGAVGVGLLLERLKGGRIAIIILIPLVLGGVVMSDSLGGFRGPGLTRSWATWNFSGLEAKPSAPVFAKLMPLLRGSPGRLANDLCEENNQLGSSRVFELVPHLIGKPILEGGLVNSALGSMYSYYVQGETSVSCAGFPPIVTPTTFDFGRATRHLELFNVKHFIARSSMTREALQSMKEWRFVAREEEWELYELMTHEGRYVFIPPRLPYVVETARWKECSLEWLYTPQALDQFVIWKMPGLSLDGIDLVTRSESVFLKTLAAMRQTNSSGILEAGKLLSVAGTQAISDESVSDDRIHFRTTALGLPHIIKMTWFPNWKVRGARRVYCVSPGFMCVFPDQTEVELYYGSTGSDVVGYALTTLGGLMVAVWIGLRTKKRGYFARSR